MLSNTATPFYYGQFRQSVLNGEIPVCEEISMQMNLIDELIRNKMYYYDSSAVEGYISFCESELTLTDGSDLYLLDTFKLWAEDIFGWYYFVEKSVPVPQKHGGIKYVKKRIKKRLRNKVYIIVARGAGKSIFGGSLHSYFLTVDSSTTKQIATAPTLRQADEVLSPIRTAIARARGPLFEWMTEGSLLNTSGNKALRKKLSPTKKGIENFVNGSVIETRPMTIDKLQGLRPFFSTVDEWLSGDVREDVIGALEQGATKLDDYLIVAISSEGTVRNGVGDSIKIELKKILRGEYSDPHTSVWWYKLDDVKEVSMPEMWLKAQPNLDKIVTYDTYQRDVERAEQSPEARNDILAKRFGLPMEGYTYYFTYEETLPTTRRNEYWNMPCALGGDLSQGNDFCAFTFLFPIGGDRFGIKAISYITERTLNNLPLATRIKYEKFIDEGSLIIQNGTILNLDEVYDDLFKFINDNQYDVRAFGYDPYNAKPFVERWETDFSPYGVEKVPQGAKTESVPLGELKILAEDRCLLFDQEIMTYCLGNCIAIVDTNGNRKLMKKSYDQKIDNVSALLDAYVAYKANKEMFD